MNNTELLKQGLDMRIKRLAMLGHCAQAQGDIAEVIRINQKKIDLCLWLTRILFAQRESVR